MLKYYEHFQFGWYKIHRNPMYADNPPFLGMDLAISRKGGLSATWICYLQITHLIQTHYADNPP